MRAQERLVGVLIAGLVAVSAVGVPQASASSPAPLSATELHQLVVAPPPPFDPLPDSVLKTGLMEFGNPNSGKIGTVVSRAQLKNAKFQRGWESVFRASDGAVVLVDVFECATPSGARRLVGAARARFLSTYTPTALAGLSGVVAVAGTSPEGRDADAAVFSRGRFFIFQDVGGVPATHDYLGILTDLATRQTAALPA